MTTRRPTRKVLLSILVVAIVAAVTGTGTYAAFSGTTANPSNAFAAGTVTISDNDAGGSLLSLSNATPGNSSTGCIKITYSGSLNGNVHLYGSSTGSLPSYLTLTVTRGTDSSPSFASCSNFTADSTNYIGSGAGVIYSQRLSAERTKSRLNKIMSSPLYKSMTIRNWATTTALMNLSERSAGAER